MKLLSIQVGLPRDVTFQGKTTTTGIFKDTVKGPVQVRTLNLDGDGQADLTVHGGIDKAVYAYGFDAYPWWKGARPQDKFELGAFGENLTLDKLPEERIYIGDTYELGGAILQVAQPRYPCFKLGIKFQDQTIIKEFMRSGRPGVYFRVLKEGAIDVGDELKLVGREKALLSVRELFLLDATTQLDRARLQEILSIPTLMPSYRKKYEKLLNALP